MKAVLDTAEDLRKAQEALDGVTKRVADLRTRLESAQDERDDAKLALAAAFAAHRQAVETEYGKTPKA